MSASTEPHEATEFWTPDQIAECLEGITQATYKALWATLESDKLPTITDAQMENGMTPADLCQMRTVAKVWDDLPAEAQENINAALTAHEAERARTPSFIITYDHLEGRVMRPKKVGLWPTDSRTFTLHDDDGVLYFTGEAVDNGKDDESLIDAYEWGMACAGTTELRINNKVEIG